MEPQNPYKFDHTELYGASSPAPAVSRREPDDASRQPIQRENSVQYSLFDDFVRILILLAVLYAGYRAFKTNPGKEEFVTAGIKKFMEVETNKMEDGYVKDIALAAIKDYEAKDTDLTKYIAFALDKDIQQTNCLLFSLFDLKYEDKTGRISAFAIGIFGEVYFLDFSFMTENL